MPAAVSPMLCTLTREPVNDPDYLYEIKFDGYRIVSYVRKGKVRLDSRSALDYTAKYPRVAAALRALKRDVVLDGEVVVFNEQGLPDFDALQKYNGHDTPISYCVFDLLWLDGYNLMELPLTERKSMLQQLVNSNPVLLFSESFDNGPALYQQMLERNLEGIVAKRKDSAYVPGERGSSWLKTPTRKRQEFVIGGYAESTRGRSFRSLLFGAYNNKKQLEWIGRSGGGYKEKEMPAILKKLQQLEIPSSPFVNPVLDTKGTVLHWVKPVIVANFEFATYTKTGRIRKPATFLSFREDKKPTAVVREIPQTVAGVQKGKRTRGKHTAVTSKEPAQQDTTNGEEQTKEVVSTPTTRKKRLPASADSNWTILEKQPPRQFDQIDIGDCQVDLTDVDRIIWKDTPKATLIQYYHSIAPFILPHLKDRPQSLHVKPNGAGAPGLYIKDMENRQPDCASLFSDKRRHPKTGKRAIIDYLVCNNEATLLYLVNLGCIDINPWMSRTRHPTQPDFFNIDLDPTEEDFSKVVEVGLAAKEVLHRLKLQAFVKTSGKTGLHIYVPVTGIDFSQARHFSEQIGGEIHELVKSISTVNVSISARQNKVFIDPSQNDYADTLAAAYSVRPHHGPTVSTPLEWKELKPGLDPAAFTIATIGKRLRRKGDLFAGTLDPAIAKKNTPIVLKHF